MDKILSKRDFNRLKSYRDDYLNFVKVEPKELRDKMVRRGFRLPMEESMLVKFDNAVNAINILGNIKPTAESPMRARMIYKSYLAMIRLISQIWTPLDD